MKKSKILAFLFLIMLFMVLIPATAEAEDPVVMFVTSDITTDTTWPAGNYYICMTEDNCEPKVLSGVTLTIESGAKVYFGDRVNEAVPGTDDKYPYPYLTVYGTLNANGVTFTTVPDAGGGTAWRDAGWRGIEARSLDCVNPASLSFTDCTFEYCSGAGTLYGVDSNGVGDGQTVNIAVSGCTFRNPIKKVTDGLYAAIRYNNGYHQAGKGNLSVTNTNITDYSHGVLVESNAHDDLNIAIDNCVFNSIGIMPVTIHSGLSASVTNCTFNDIQTSRDGVAYIFTDYEESNKDQTVTLTGNTFNGDAATNKYPVVVGANARINENMTGDAGNTFSEAYPAAYRYIRFIGGIGNGSTANENAVWGVADIPYLLTSDVRVYENGTKDDGIHSSLVIKPGVTVYFDAGVGLNIEGELSAIGEAAKPITIQKKPGANWCFALGAGGSLEGPISLKYCNFIDLNSGINIQAQSTAAMPPAITIENCTIESVNYQTGLKGKSIAVKDCSFTGPGVDLGYSRDVSLTDCTITVDAGSDDGVNIEYGEGTTLQGCDIIASGGYGTDGVSIYNSKNVVLENCLVAGFPNYGIRVNRNLYATVEEGAPLIENCTVATNGKAGVVFQRYADNEHAYGAFIKNCIIAENGNALPEGEPKLDIVRTNMYSLTIPDGSITCSLIERDGAPFTEGTAYVDSHYEHPTFGIIYPMPDTAYIGRVGGPAQFADSANGDYHLKSEAGRWNGSTWVNDDVTSNCINAGDPTSAYANEPAPNGGRVNIGCYGNTAVASKSDAASASYTVILPNGKIEGGWTAYTAAAYGESISPLASGGNYSFTITVGNAYYKTEAFKVKVNGVELTAVGGVYTISNITTNQTVTVEGVARIESPIIITQPTDQSVVVGQEAVFSIVATGYNVTYTWRVSMDGGITWEIISGATGAHYTVSSPTLSQSGWKYYCIATSSTDDGSSRFSRMSNNATLTVTDNSTKYAIAVSASPLAGGTVSGGGSVDAGASVTVTATANENYRFVRWEEDGAQISTAASYTFNATADRALIAIFENDQLPQTEIGSGESVSSDDLDQLIHADASLTVQSRDGAKLLFDTDALKGISEQISGSFKVEITDQSAEYQQAHPGNTVFSLDIISGDKKITDFGGSVIVSLPYELKDGETAENVTVWHLKGNGVMIEIPCEYSNVTKLASFTVSHFSLYVLGVAQAWINPFDDVAEDAWYYGDVAFANQNDLFKGTSETTFAPETAMNRAMLVTVLWRMEGKPISAKANSFTDVTDGTWYTNAVIWAADNKIVEGYGNGKFGPTDDITREQMATVLYRYSAHKGYDVDDAADISKFTDSSKISAFAVTPISWANANELITGKGNNMLDPLGDATRCQVAAILHRFNNGIVK